MSVFSVGYKELILNRYIENESDRFNESTYASDEIIEGIIYGDKQYNRDEQTEDTVSNYICQTIYTVKNKDKINDYIVTAVNKHYNLFGQFDYWEVSLRNG